MKEEIIKFVERNSTLHYEGCNSDEDHLAFATRENGDIGEELYSDIDYKNVLNVERLVKTEFGINNIVTNLDVVDEWVLLDIEYTI
jgi:hypothetical protein